jgi:hypothetical protein
MAYDANISIGGLTLLINPERYSKSYMKMGSFARTTVGNLIGQDVSGKKYAFKIDGLTQSQIEDIKKRAALEYNVALIDYVPIAERESQSRTVYQDISNESINGETIYLYIPSYTVAITEFTDSYEGNVVTYGIVAEEQ